MGPQELSARIEVVFARLGVVLARKGVGYDGGLLSVFLWKWELFSTAGQAFLAETGFLGAYFG